MEAYLKKKEDLGEELADMAIYLAGIAEILKADLETEISKKVEKNRKRKYVKRTESCGVCKHDGGCNPSTCFVVCRRR